MSYSLLAPIIVASVVALVGLAVLFWMNNSEPQFQPPVGSEEEPDLPFDERTPAKTEKRVKEPA